MTRLSFFFIVAAAVCGTFGAALMKPGLVALGAWCLGGLLLTEGICAAVRKGKERR